MIYVINVIYNNNNTITITGTALCLTKSESLALISFLVPCLWQTYLPGENNTLLHY